VWTPRAARGKLHSNAKLNRGALANPGFAMPAT
jgi:hypothetical protein